MGEQNPPFALQNAGATHTAAGDRSMLSGLIAGRRASGTTIISRGGVSPSTSARMGVAQTSTPSMGVQVFSGVAYVPGTEALTQGVYCCVSDGGTILSIPTAHGTLPRIDSVIVRVYDSQYSGATNTWALEVISGTPASSPVEPTLPANSLRLANVNVGAAVTSITNSNILDKRYTMVAAGGIIPVANSAERDALNAVIHDGQAAFRDDTGTLEIFWGGQWHVRSQQRILTSNQISAPSFAVTGSYIDFPSGAWAPITFSAPRSGSIRVTVSASIFNNNTTTSTIWAAYRISGAITQGADESLGLSTHGSGSRLYGSRSRVFNGLTVGASGTVTPQWNISSGNAGTCLFTGGQLTVELLP